MFCFYKKTSWRELIEMIVNHETNREENKTTNIWFLRMILKYRLKQARARAKQERSSYVRKRDTIEKQAQAIKQAVRKTGAAWWEREERKMVWWEDERGSL